MPRGSREKCNCSIYHISVRGNNKQSIFCDDEDRVEYLKRLKRYKERYMVDIYAYCLMTNHIHLLIFDNDQDISKFMQGLNLSYAIYFNNKYNYTGHLFQERFSSQLVKNEAYLIYVSKYIHRNPIKAQLVQQPEAYKWSSYTVYLGEVDRFKIVDTGFVLSFFAPTYEEAQLLYEQYVSQQEEQELGEEIATTIDNKIEESFVRRGLVRTSISVVFETVEAKWKVKVAKLLHGDKVELTNKYNMLIYLVVLIGRLSYKQAAKIMGTSIACISMGIRKAVELIIKENRMYNEREIIINLLS